MRLLFPVISITLLSITSVALGQGETSNTAPLVGGPAAGFNILPPLPPTGFHAWCETSQGLCMVQGNAPIAPGSLCHCAQHEGRTA